MKVFKGRTLVEGIVVGKALVSRDPISFYGGVDPKTGTIVEKGHSIHGCSIKDSILIFPYGKGSTVGAYVLYGLARRGLAPKAIINLRSEIIVLVGCILGDIPLMDSVDRHIFEEVRTGDEVKVVAKSRKGVVIIKDGEEN